MRKASVGLLLALVCLLTACSQKKTVEMPISISDVLSIESEGQRLHPQHNWVFSFHDGLAADGQRLYFKDIAPLLTETDTISVPFSLELHDSVRSASYTLYSEWGTELYSGSRTLSFPEEPGLYLCVIELSYGSADDREGVQFFFQFTIC